MLGKFLSKIISKILADRLAPIANKILLCNQFGFIHGRNIQDCISTAFKCVNLMDCFGRNMVVKVDIKKALDTLDWNILFAVLKSFGFSAQFCSWIWSNLSLARISIMHNGSLFGYFGCSRGFIWGILFLWFCFVLLRIFLVGLLMLRRFIDALVSAG